MFEKGNFNNTKPDESESFAFRPEHSTGTQVDNGLGSELVAENEAGFAGGPSNDINPLLICIGLEIFHIVLHFASIVETLDNIGFVAETYLADIPILNLIFQYTPDVTFLHFLSLFAALVFVGTPILVWKRILKGVDFTKLKHNLDVLLLTVTYLPVIALEFAMMNYRIDLGVNSVWVNLSSYAESISVALSIFFVITNVATAYATARFSTPDTRF